MSRIVFILGDSGSGKSTSLRNLTKEELSVMSITGKELPFRTDVKVNTAQTYESVISWIKDPLLDARPIMVLDDANYLMSKYEFTYINEAGYGKFARNALGIVGGRNEHNHENLHSRF